MESRIIKRDIGKLIVHVTLSDYQEPKQVKWEFEICYFVEQKEDKKHVEMEGSGGQSIGRGFYEKKNMIYCAIRNAGWNYLRFLTLWYPTVHILPKPSSISLYLLLKVLLGIQLSILGVWLQCENVCRETQSLQFHYCTGNDHWEPRVFT